MWGVLPTAGSYSLFWEMGRSIGYLMYLIIAMVRAEVQPPDGMV